MLSADYIVGLVDGEGSFCVYLRPPDKETWNTRVECHFYVKMRQDELPLLRNVLAFFGCGSILFQKEYRENQQDNYRFHISNLRRLHEVVLPFFRSHMLHSTARKRDFNLFDKIVTSVIDGHHQTPSGLRAIVRWKASMHA